MDHVQGAGLISRRQAVILLGAVAAARSAGAAEPGILQPVSLDHVNIRVSNVPRSGAFYVALFDTPVLRSTTLRAQPNSPPSEGFFIKFGDGYLAISQAFASDTPGLDHYSLGLRDYDKARMTAKMQDGGISALPRSGGDLWVADLDGSLMQLRKPGGWARQSATPYQGPARVGPALSPLSMSRMVLRSADLARAGDYYSRLFGTEIASAASNRARAFSVGDSIVELVSAGSAPGPLRLTGSTTSASPSRIPPNRSGAPCASVESRWRTELPPDRYALPIRTGSGLNSRRREART
jgi:catechol 2,3-dioxygenase-like lactoylglutathione lyase family enzyme